MRMLGSVVVLLAILALSSTSAVEACSCLPYPESPAPVCYHLGRSSAVFVGTVLEVMPTPRPTPGPRPTPTPGGQDIQVRFRVDETFKGTLGSEVTVGTAASSGICGYTFVTGASYLVFATSTPLYTGLCSGTKTLATATSDLSALRTGACSSSSPPGAPSNVRATWGSGSSCTSSLSVPIKVEWDAAAGALSYNVKRGSTSGGPYNTVRTGLSGLVYSEYSPGFWYFVVSAVNAQQGPSSSEAFAGYEGPLCTPTPTATATPTATLTPSGTPQTPPTSTPTPTPSPTTAADSEWQAGTTYAVGDVVSFGGRLFRCRQSHTSQVGWEPPNAPALWEPVV